MGNHQRRTRRVDLGPSTHSLPPCLPDQPGRFSGRDRHIAHARVVCGRLSRNAAWRAEDDVTGRLDRTLNYTILVAFSVIALYPIVTMMLIAMHRPEDTISGFGIPDHFDLHNFVSAWKTGHFSTYLRSSTVVSGVVVVVASVLSILGGYAFGTMRFRGDNLLFYVLLLGLILPYEAVIIPLYYDLRSVSLVDTYWGLILPEIGFALP